MVYDYVIIGGGPSGLSTAHLLSKSNKVLLVDKEESLGGCHRVKYIDNYYTEHACKVYSSAYVNFNKILNDLGTDITKEFVPFNSTMTSIGGFGFSDFSNYEMLSILGAFCIFLVNGDYGKNISVEEFSSNFSPEAQEYINSLCKLSDGADYKRYSLYQFLQIINEQGLHTLYQPKAPMSVLMKKWRKYLEDSGVDIIRDTITSLEGKDTIVSANGKYFGKNFILAIPPKNISNLIKNNEFGLDFHNFADKTNYDKYISITFHWDTKLDLPKLTGYPESDWGLVFIVLTDYMKSVDNIPGEQTVISCTIDKLDNKYLGKTANESTNDELISRTFEQLKLAYPGLPQPFKSLVSTDTDTAYFATVGTTPIPFTSNISNLYNVGSQNGYQKYNFTSFESAISNAFALVKELGHTSYSIDSGITVKWLFWVIIAVIIVIIVLYLDAFHYKSS